MEETKEELQAQANRLIELGRPVPQELLDAIAKAKPAPKPAEPAKD